MALLLSAAQMRAVDKAATDLWGLPSLVLMENAGRGTAAVVSRALGGVVGRDVRVVCGAGQNGGDGFVAARHLVGGGARVTILLVAPRTKVAGDAALFAGIAERVPAIRWWDGSSADEASWRERLRGADAVVDALFGTGLRADVTGVPALAIAAMNDTPALRVAVDVPSGLDADTGAVRGLAVRAHVTATMGCRKLGLVLDPRAPVGNVEVIDLGVSVEALAEAAGSLRPLAHWTDTAEVAAYVPRWSLDAHKGSRGHVLIIAGSPGRTGAALLAARGAHRGGAGLVTVASTREGQRALDGKVVETMTVSYADGDDGDVGSYDRLGALATRMKVAALGPGIPTGPGMSALVARLLAEWPSPLVVDADALNLAGTEVAALTRAAPAPRILTPHPGEMAHLCGISTAQVQADRLGHARRLAAAARAVVVLKGARTIVVEPDGTAHVNPAAEPALGTAGSGDVLTGLLAALWSQGLTAPQAARLGVHVHGLAAEEAMKSLGLRNLMAGDLPEAVARVLATLGACASNPGPRGA